MARIRIVDQWLRSPASPPTYYRSVMVVAEQWAEQRVLMRAYAESADQTRPTIVLHGGELAIGPASLDPNGPWGIHVQPPADGRAQSLKDALALAARRMSGSKGNPPRLEDEVSGFDRKRTNNWGPGEPRDLPGDSLPGPGWEPAVAASLHATASASAIHGAAGSGGAYLVAGPGTAIVFPAGDGHAAASIPGRTAVPVPQHQTASYVPSAPAAELVPMGPIPMDAGLGVTPPNNPGERRTPLPVRWALEEHRRRAAGGKLARTQLGYSSGAGAQSAVIRLGLRPGVAARLARLVDRTVPADFQISQLERAVLNALGERDHLNARAIGELVGVVDGVAWMEALVDKLERYGLDLIAPGEASGSEPTYVLRA